MNGFPPQYSAQEQLSAPARPCSELWRTVSGTVLGAVIFISLTSSIAGVLMPRVAGNHGGMGSALVQIFLVALMGVAAIIVTVMVHRRAWHTLIGDVGTALRDFKRVLGVQVMLILPVLIAVTLVAPYDVYPAAGFGAWLLVLPVSLVVIMLQCTGEEIVFRGYLQQQISARSTLPALWMGVPSALFGLAHYAPVAYGDNAMWIAIWSGCFGIAMADLTARSGTIGAAIAVHFAVNVWAIMAVALPGPLVGLALFVLSFGPSDIDAVRNLMPVEFMTLLVSWLAARFALRR